MKGVESGEIPGPVFFATISEPLGIVPMDMWDDFPAYDVPGLFGNDPQRTGMFTADWNKSQFGQRYMIPFDKEAKDKSIDILGDVVAKFVENNQSPDRRFISFVDAKDMGSTTHSLMLERAEKTLDQEIVPSSLRFGKTDPAASRPSAKATYDHIRQVLVGTEEGNPAIDEPSLSRFPDVQSMLSVGGFGTLSSTRIATMQNEETGNPSVESGYNQSIDIGPVVEFAKDATEKSVRADGLYETMLMIEAEYTSLSKEDRNGKRGQVLQNWYDQTSDEFTAAETVREQTEYDRYFRGSDFYYDTMPGGVEKYDDSRAFSIRAERGPKIVMDIEIREAQENEQRERFSQTVSNGAAAVNLFGSAGPMNRYLMNKAKAFNHPVQSVQLNFSEKVSLKEDISNVQDLHEAGLISFLLYKELIGDVELL